MILNEIDAEQGYEQGYEDASDLIVPEPEEEAEAVYIDASDLIVSEGDDAGVIAANERASSVAKDEGPVWGGGLRPFDRVRNYELLDRIGTGGMAEVFLARCELGNAAEKLAALKMVLPEFGPGTPFATLFLNEARVSASLQHPNLVQVFDTGEAAGRGYLAMEYIHGRSLNAVMAKLHSRGQLPPPGLALEVGIQLCHALEHLHAKRGLDGRLLNLVHRDLSPGNVRLSDSGEVKLLDFGVAAVSSDEGSEALIVGKRAYMAPEQALGKTPSPNWDLYSLGVILHELLTLKRLFSGDTALGAMRVKRARGQLPPSASNPQVPASLDRLVLWLTDPDPLRRAQSAGMVRAALGELRSQIPPCDPGRLMQSLFGDDLRHERTRIEALFAAAQRRRSNRHSNRGLLDALNQVRRRVQTSPGFRRLSRHRWLIRWGSIALMLLLIAGGSALWSHHRRAVGVDRALAELDLRLSRSELAGPGGGTALDALVELRALAPSDPRVTERTRILTELFLTLGRAAEGRGDLGEAAVHYQAAVDASPTRTELRAHLTQIEDQVRKRVVAEEPAP